MIAVSETISTEKTTVANIAQRLDEIARSRPDQPALIEGSRRTGRSISYRALSKKVARKAGVLKENGLSYGDQVLMMEPMSIDLFASILAVFRLGATVLILDPSAGIDKLTHAIARTKPRAVIASGKSVLAAVAINSVRKIKLKFSDGFTPPGWFSLRETSWHRPAPVEPIDGRQPALITMTSGTSGIPKLIVRSHNFLRTQLDAVSTNCDVKPGSCELTSLPVFILANLASSVTSVIPETNLSQASKLNTPAVVEQIQGHYTDRILASPSFVERIMDHCIANDVKLMFVKTVITGGGPVFPRLLRKTSAVCPRAEVVTVYGSTEAEPISKIAFSSLSERDKSAIANGAGLPVGSPIPEVNVRIASLVGEQSELTDISQLATLRHICEVANIPIDAVGEIIVTGDHVVKSYASGIGDAETKIEIDGCIWHKTGDIGYFDRHGRLWLTGRKMASQAVSARNKIDTSFAQCMEAVALLDEHIHRAACVTVDSATTLFVETDNTRLSDLWSIKSRLNWGNLNDIKVVHKIPVDARHSSKVLYNKLASVRRTQIK